MHCVEFSLSNRRWGTKFCVGLTSHRGHLTGCELRYYGASTAHVLPWGLTKAEKVCFWSSLVFSESPSIWATSCVCWPTQQHSFVRTLPSFLFTIPLHRFEIVHLCSSFYLRLCFGGTPSRGIRIPQSKENISGY